MNRVDTTAFITPALTRPCLEGAQSAAAVKPLWRWLLAAVCTLLLVLQAAPALAHEPEVLQSRLQRSADGLQLSVRLALAPSPAVEDALLKGVPIYFAWQTEVVRERWYWTDKRISAAARTLRLAYQPLTRRWRVSLSTDGGAIGTGLQYALHQNFDSLADALSGISRVVSWQIAEPGRLEEGGRYQAQWRFRLDLSLLPRPFQIGMVNQPDWVIEVQRNLDVPANDDAEARPEGATSDAR
jgi:Domain of unknown function (DUF4390)